MMRKQKISGLVLAAVVAACALAVLGCKAKPVNPFPASDTVAGWQKTSEMRTFKSADLWQYIDGGSDQFVKAGVGDTLTADYKYQNSTEATVDVYVMSDSSGAKTMLEASPAADAKSASIGDEARLYAQSLSFRKGKYLVKVVSFTGGPGVSDALLALGHGVEGRL